MFIYHGWHLSKGIIYYSDESFFKPTDKYYKEAVSLAKSSLNEFLELLETEESYGLLLVKFKNYNGKVVRAEAIVESVSPETQTFNVLLIKEFNKELENDYTNQSVSFNDVEDWLYPLEDETFRGGHLIQAKIRKADEKGYIFDYHAEPFVQYIRTNAQTNIDSTSSSG